jgi:transposase
MGPSFLRAPKIRRILFPAAARDVRAAAPRSRTRASRLGEALAVLAGEECKIHFFAMDLPHSDACLVQAYPAESSEAFCEGHKVSFEFFGGVPRSILYDNLKLAVARILGDGTRRRTRIFSELQSHYLFADRFGPPRSGEFGLRCKAGL